MMYPGVVSTKTIHMIAKYNKFIKQSELTFIINVVQRRLKMKLEFFRQKLFLVSQIIPSKHYNIINGQLFQRYILGS